MWKTSFSTLTNQDNTKEKNCGVFISGTAEGINNLEDFYNQPRHNDIRMASEKIQLQELVQEAKTLADFWRICWMQKK